MLVQELFPGQKSDARIRRLLHDYAGETVEDIPGEAELIRIPGIYKKSVEIIKTRLKQHGMRLAA